MSLEKIRHAGDSLLFKIFLGLIILSFAIWGISDIFKTNKNIVATIADESITYAEFHERVEKEKKNLADIPDSREKQIYLSRIEQVSLQNLINAKIYKITAKKFGIDISQDVAAQEVLNFEFFHDDSKKFDKTKFSQILKHNNLTESKFLKMIQAETAISYTNNLLAKNWLNKSYLNENIKSYLEDKIEYNLYKVTPNANKEYDISNAEIESYFKENPNKFKQEEQKTIIFAKIDYAKLKKNIKLTEEEKKELELQLSEYKNDNKSDYKKQLESELIENKASEKYLQILSDIEHDLQNSVDIDYLVRKYNLEKKYIQNINQKQHDIEDINIATSNIEILNEPVLVDLGDEQGSAIVEVVEVKPEYLKDISAVKQEIIAILNKQKAYDSFYKCAEQNRENIINNKISNISNHCNIVDSKKSFIRYENFISTSKDDIIELNEQLMNLKTGDVSKIVALNDKLYFAKVIKITPGEKNDLVNKIVQNFIESYNHEEEILYYLRNLYDVKINYKL